MEEKKFDVQSLIGFFLIGGILIWMLYNNSFENNEAEDKKVTTEQVETTSTEAATPQKEVAIQEMDSTARAKVKESLGTFGYSATLPSASNNTTKLANDVLDLSIENKGGYISEARMTQFKTYDSIPVYLIKDGNASLNLNFTTADGRVINTKDMYFEPSLSTSGDNQILSMKLKVSESEYLEYVYVMKPGEYMLDFSIRSQGLRDVISSSSDVNLDWQLKGYRHSKSISYE
ncbi:MAG TPA: YidC/Oxa1 family insertase periplasmic-domain containing protein, partial [Gillisia sp.]|nr:YidC/Oxa1 family insertase periplasmic-domain containing protein [Gillisia sp.]